MKLHTWIQIIRYVVIIINLRRYLMVTRNVFSLKKIIMGNKIAKNYRIQPPLRPWPQICKSPKDKLFHFQLLHYSIVQYTAHPLIMHNLTFFRPRAESGTNTVRYNLNFKKATILGEISSVIFLWPSTSVHKYCFFFFISNFHIV